MSVLDTDVLIDLMGASGKRLRETARDYVADLIRSGEQLLTTRLNEAELLGGVERAAYREIELDIVTTLLRGFAILEVTPAATSQFGLLKAVLTNQGTTVGDFDLMIASIAIVHEQSVITRNLKDFQRIPGGLRVLTY